MIFIYLRENFGKSTKLINYIWESVYPITPIILSFSQKLFEKEEDNNYFEDLANIQCSAYNLYFLLINNKIDFNWINEKRTSLRNALTQLENSLLEVNKVRISFRNN